jgi:hypothetical protein
VKRTQVNAMNQAISPGLVPPPTGLEREEPEIADELDIPTGDSHEPSAEAEKQADIDSARKPAPESGTSEHPAA